MALPLRLALAVTRRGMPEGLCFPRLLAPVPVKPAKLKTADGVARSPVLEAGNTHISGWRWTAS